MKFTLLVSISAASLLAALAMPVRLAAQEGSAAQEHRTDVRYRVTDLGPAPPNFPFSPFIAGNGLVAGSAPNPDGTVHAVLWYKGRSWTSAHLDSEDRTVQRSASTKGARPWVKLKLQFRIAKTFAASTRMGFPRPVLHVSLSCGKTAS